MNNVNVNNLAGHKGGQYINDTSATTPEESDGSWFAIQAVNGADAVVNSITGNITGLTGSLTIPSGHIIYGNYTAITLTSGAVICYKRAK